MHDLGVHALGQVRGALAGHLPGGRRRHRGHAARKHDTVRAGDVDVVALLEVALHGDDTGGEQRVIDLNKPGQVLTNTQTPDSVAQLAQTLIEEWSTAKFPPPPALKPAKIEPKETALLVMDFTRQTCTPERRKRCSDSVAKVLKLVTEARAKGALIIYSVAVPNSVPADILPELTPAAGEQLAQLLPVYELHRHVGHLVGAAWAPHWDHADDQVLVLL